MLFLQLRQLQLECRGAPALGKLRLTLAFLALEKKRHHPADDQSHESGAKEAPRPEGPPEDLVSPDERDQVERGAGEEERERRADARSVAEDAERQGHDVARAHRDHDPRADRRAVGDPPLRLIAKVAQDLGHGHERRDSAGQQVGGEDDGKEIPRQDAALEDVYGVCQHPLCQARLRVHQAIRSVRSAQARRHLAAGEQEEPWPACSPLPESTLP